VHAVCVAHTNIPRELYSTRCTMPSLVCLTVHQYFAHAPFTKLSCDNIYPHCACTNKTPLYSTNTTHTTRAIIIFLWTPKIYCAHLHTNIFPRDAQNLVHTPTFFHAVSNFYRAHLHTNIFPCSVEFLHISRFYRATCIFSVPTHAHSFLCASIPCEFYCRNWGFFLTFSPIHHGNSATMKFVQFHLDNTNSTSATKNRFGLTFLE
jgi:hypothetical protein